MNYLNKSFSVRTSDGVSQERWDSIFGKKSAETNKAPREFRVVVEASLLKELLDFVSGSPGLPEGTSKIVELLLGNIRDAENSLL